MERNWRQGVASASSCDDWSQSCDCPNRIAFDGGRVSPQSDPVTRYAVLRTPVPVPRLCVLFFSLLFLPGHCESSPLSFCSHFRHAFGLCSGAYFASSVALSFGISLVSILREYSHTSKISRRSYGPDRSPPRLPSSLLSWYLMTTLFIHSFILSSSLFFWILVLFLISFWNRTSYIPY